MDQVRYTPIGYISSPFTKPEGMPIQPAGAENVKGEVILKEEYTAGLKDLEGFSHIILLCHFHLSSGFELEVVPFLDETLRGVFATRAPRRPNPIGLSVVKLTEIHDNVLHIENLDIVDGTPVLDIKPYVPGFAGEENVRTGWLEQTDEEQFNRKSDDRFRSDREASGQSD